MAEDSKTTTGGNKLQIRNSTVDFLVFTKDAHEEGIEVRVQDHDVWLTQKAIGQLFDVDRSVVTKHLKNIYESRELDEATTCANFAQVAANGKTYQYKFYSHNTTSAEKEAPRMRHHGCATAMDSASAEFSYHNHAPFPITFSLNFFLPLFH